MTLADVARAAGVALGTASRVMNNFPDVAPDARARVLKAANRLQYRPLRRRRSGSREAARGGVRGRNIGLILLGMDDSLVHLPVLSEVLHGIESAVTQVNGNLLLANLPNADRVPAFLRDNQVEGLILKISQYNELPDPESSPLVKHMLRFPLVWVWGRPESAPGDVCGFNHETAALLVARHLAAKGHRRVAFLNPKKGKSSLEHLKNQFQLACTQRELQFSALESASAWAATWPESALSNEDDLLPLVHQWKAMAAERRPTAIFVPADNIALLLYNALAQNSIEVGRDISVISCNNEKSLVRASKPTLTTIDVNAAQIGAKTVEQLLARMRNPLEAAVQTVLFEPTLVEGASVAQL